MQNIIVGIYDPNEEKYIKATPYIYNGTSWEKILPQVYTNATWKAIGGAGDFFYHFLEQQGKYYNQREHLLVREGKYNKWIDNEGRPIRVTDSYVTTGDSAKAQYVFKQAFGRLALQDSSFRNLLDQDSRQLMIIEEV